MPALNAAVGNAWASGAIAIKEGHLYVETVQSLLRQSMARRALCLAPLEVWAGGSGVDGLELTPRGVSVIPTLAGVLKALQRWRRGQLQKTGASGGVVAGSEPDLLALSLGAPGRLGSPRAPPHAVPVKWPSRSRPSAAHGR